MNINSLITFGWRSTTYQAIISLFPNLIILVSAMINVAGVEEVLKKGKRRNTACKVLWYTHVQYIQTKKKGSIPSKNLLSIRDQRIFIATSLSVPH